MARRSQVATGFLERERIQTVEIVGERRGEFRTFAGKHSLLEVFLFRQTVRDEGGLPTCQGN